MAGKSKKYVPDGRITIQFFPNEVRVEIEDWEKITVAKLERGINHLYKQYYQLRRTAVYARRKEEQEALERRRVEQIALEKSEGAYYDG